MKKLILKNNDTIRQKIYHHIREEIIRGAIAPNERLVEAQIAKEIGTSRTPVREALHNLELEKLIRSIPRVGYVVEAISEGEAQQICEIRAALEGLAIRWAMEKAHQRLVQELAKNLADQQKAIARADMDAYLQIDAQFHESIAGLSGSDRLFELVQTLIKHMRRYWIRVAFEMESALRSHEGHKQIFAMIERGSTDTAVQEIQNHLCQAQKDIVQYVFSTERCGAMRPATPI